MLLKQIPERLIRKPLEALHAILGQPIQRQIRLSIECNASSHFSVFCHYAARLLLRFFADLRDLGPALLLLDDDDLKAAARLPRPLTL